MSDSAQIHVELLVHNVQSDLADLIAMRRNPVTAHLLTGEEANLSSAMTALQVLLTHMQGSSRPKLQVVR